MPDEKKYSDPEDVITKLTGLSLTDLPNGSYSAGEIVTGAEHWYRYAITYKEAGDRLAELVDTTYRRNMLVGPMMFLYRHAIELHLKSLLLDAGELLDDPQTVPQKHYLLKLWLKVRAMLLQIDSRESEWILRADNVIKQFDDLDPSSMSFRYPANGDGTPLLPKNLLIDPSVASQVVAELHVLLDGASNQISMYAGFKHDSYY
jgi:hypothetical protein